MTAVDFFKMEVKYSGKYEDYSNNDLIRLALARTDRSDCESFYKTEMLEDTEAERHDGKFWVEHTNPCDHIATVFWSYIAESEDEEE